MRIACALVLVVACSPSSTPEPTAPPLDIPPLPASATVQPKPVVSNAPPAEEPVQRDPKAAEEAFRLGREAFQRGDFTTARDRFAESHRLDPAVGTLLNLAETELRLGDNANARRHYQDAYDRAMAAGQKDRAA